MSNSIIHADKAKAVLADFKRRHPPAQPPRIPILLSEASGIASTYIFARKDGGVGVSTLIRMISYSLGVQPFIIQVGGMKSWAFKDLADDDFVHIKPHEDQDRFSPPLDKRLEQPGRVAIIEYEQAMPIEAIKAANLLSGRFASHAVLCVVASANDTTFRIAKTARENGVERLLLFREHDLQPGLDSGVIQIPTVPRLMAQLMREDPTSFAEYADGWWGPVSGLTFYEKLNALGKQIVEQLA